MKSLFCLLVFAISFALHAQALLKENARNFECRKVTPADYEVDFHARLGYCFLKRGSPETGAWGIEYLMDSKREKATYKDESGKRDCAPRFDSFNRLFLIRCGHKFALAIIRHCSNPDRFFGVFRDTKGIVMGSDGIQGNYLVECRPRQE